MTNLRESPESGISAREAEVLEALGEHLTNAEIAARLFISVRTVESHVSSLLRKLGVGDRRALATVAAPALGGAATLDATGPDPGGPGAAGAGAGTPGTVPDPRAGFSGGRGGPPVAPGARLPTRLTSFVGRAAELAELDAALAAHRLVTAVGPGGVGKTRLAVQVADRVADRFPDGTWFVDLVPVTDPAMIVPAVATALGLGERLARTALDTVAGWLATRRTFLVVDNCEHLIDGVGIVLERLLAACPGLTVLATSRARLLVPFEQVFAVPGLSVRPAPAPGPGAEDGTVPGDAVALFLDRAAAGGVRVRPEDLPRVATVCQRLDGTALAIELAAARLPSLGLDGLEAGLADRLRLLEGGSRVDERHRSLRSTLDWSYDLLDGPARAVLRRTSVFAGAFTAAAAQAVLGGWEPVAADAVPQVLATLADQSLLVPVARPGGTRYRALETVRQYAAERRIADGESPRAHLAHLEWCLRTAADLAAEPDTGTGSWRVAFDQVGDELRAALQWACPRAEHRERAHRLALLLADLTFDRGLHAESQRRYEQAAGLAADPAQAWSALHRAAGTAEVRFVGHESVALRRAAADAALQAGEAGTAGLELALAAELIFRGAGIMGAPPDREEGAELLARARDLAGDDDRAHARLLATEVFRGEDADPATLDLAEGARAHAHRAGDPLAESAALDAVTVIQLRQGDVPSAAASTRLRLALLAPLRMTADSGMEFQDAYAMATDCALAAGDLWEARALARRMQRLPFHEEEGHLSSTRLLLVATLAGDWDEALRLAERFLEGWERACRPRASSLSRGAWAAATVHGFRGESEARDRWLAVARDVETPRRARWKLTSPVILDTMLFLHTGRIEEARQRLEVPADHRYGWHDGLWRPWHAALQAEAAVLARAGEAPALVRRARSVASGNPVAEALVDRAEALLTKDEDRLVATAVALEALGSRYEAARARALSSGSERERGEAALAALGTSPPAVRP